MAMKSDRRLHLTRISVHLELVTSHCFSCMAWTSVSISKFRGTNLFAHMDVTQALDRMSIILVKTDKNKESQDIFLTEGERVLYGERAGSKASITKLVMCISVSILISLL